MLVVDDLRLNAEGTDGVLEQVLGLDDLAGHPLRLLFWRLVEEVAGGIVILARLFQGGGGQFHRHLSLVERGAFPVLRLEVHGRSGGYPFPLRLPFPGEHLRRGGVLALLEEGTGLGGEAGLFHVLAEPVVLLPVPGEVLFLRQRFGLGGYFLCRRCFGGFRLWLSLPPRPAGQTR